MHEEEVLEGEEMVGRGLEVLVRFIEGSHRRRIRGQAGTFVHRPGISSVVARHEHERPAASFGGEVAVDLEGFDLPLVAVGVDRITPTLQRRIDIGGQFLDRPAGGKRVAGIPDTVAILVGLEGVGKVGTVVAGIGDAVAVGVRVAAALLAGEDEAEGDEEDHLSFHWSNLLSMPRGRRNLPLPEGDLPPMHPHTPLRTQHTRNRQGGQERWRAPFAQ